MAQPAPKTRLDLVTAALRALRILRADENQPSPEDYALVSDAYTGVYAELANVGVAYWPEDEIPVLVVRPLAKLLAADVASEFGKAFDPADALDRIYAAAAKPWSGDNIQGLSY
jgi:hypothetical protein